MTKSIVRSFVLLCSSILPFALTASEQEGSQNSEVDIEEVIAMCEEKYTVEEYADEEERNSAINQCIEESSQAPQGSAEDLG
jgi:hypothetical protein